MDEKLNLAQTWENTFLVKLKDFEACVCVQQWQK